MEDKGCTRSGPHSETHCMDEGETLEALSGPETPAEDRPEPAPLVRRTVLPVHRRAETQANPNPILPTQPRFSPNAGHPSYEGVKTMLGVREPSEGTR